MATINFTNNLKRHLDCSSQNIPGETLKEVLTSLFSNNQKLAGYIVDDQDKLRKHVLISIDNEIISDSIHFSDALKPDSEIYIFQALSGG